MIGIFKYTIKNLKKVVYFVFNIMHDWGAVDPKTNVGPRYHGHSISTWKYEFCLHLAQSTAFILSSFLTTIKRPHLELLNLRRYIAVPFSCVLHNEAYNWKCFSFLFSNLNSGFHGNPSAALNVPLSWVDVSFRRRNAQGSRVAQFSHS